MANDFC
jgi:serine/threonine protein kinase